MKFNLENLTKGTYKGIKKIPKYIVETAKSKPYWVDTLTALSFFEPIKLFNELVINNLDIDTCLDARKIGIPIAMGIVRPICKLRDYWAEKVWKINENSSKRRKVLSDLSFLTITQPVIYSTVLALAGAEAKEIATAVPTGYAATLACASIYVPYLNFMRKKFKTSSFEDKVNSNKIL